MVGEGAGAAALGDGFRLGGTRVGHADQLHVGHPGQDAGVLLAQVADADDRHSQPCHGHIPPSFTLSPWGRGGGGEGRLIPTEENPLTPNPSPPRGEGERF